MENFLLAAALVVTAGVAILISEARPTGLDVVDDLWVGGLTALVGYFAGHGRRWTWFLPAAAGAALAADNVALACAGVAIVLGFVSVLTDYRSRPYAALVAGLGTAALLHMDPVGFHGVTALIAAAAMLPALASGYRLAGRTARRRIKRVAGWSAAVCGLMIIGGVVGILTSYKHLNDGARLIDRGILAARDAEDTEASLRLGEAARHMSSAEEILTSWFVQPAHALPVVGPNIRAVSAMASDTAEASQASSAAADAADLDQLRFEGGRLDPQRIENLIGPMENVATSAQTAQSTVENMRSGWLVEPVQSRMDKLADELDTNLPDLEAAVEALRVASPIMGSEGDRRYLVLITTPAEARGRTGFPGNYAELTFRDGQLDMPRFGRIRELEEGGNPDGREISGPEDYLARYSRFEPARTWRNIVMSPDFPTVAQVAMELYPQSGGQEVDGVLSVDPTGLAALMQFTGDVHLEEQDRTLTAENVEQFLYFEQYSLYEEQYEERKDLLGDVAEETLNQLMEVSLPAPSEVVDVLGPAVASNHIQFTSKHEAEATYFNSIEADGALGGAEGDSLAVTTANAGASKIDGYLNRSLAYDLIMDGTTGQVHGTITVTLRNNATADEPSDQLVGNNIGLPRGTNRSFVSVYTRWLLDEARINGEPASMESGRELDRYVYSKFVDIPPQSEIVIELDVSGPLDMVFYSLNLYPAPLISPEQARVNVAVVGAEGEALRFETGDGEVIEGDTLQWEGTLDEPMEWVLAREE